MSSSGRPTLVRHAARVLACSAALLAACAPRPNVSVPLPTAAPTLLPLPSAAPAADSLARMQALLERGIADGQISRGGEQLLQSWARAQRALGTRTHQSTNAAKQQLLVMQLQIVQGTGAKTIDAAFGQALLVAIDGIAREYNLGLPQTFTRRSGG